MLYYSNLSPCHCYTTPPTILAPTDTPIFFIIHIHAPTLCDHSPCPLTRLSSDAELKLNLVHKRHHLHSPGSGVKSDWSRRVGPEFRESSLFHVDKNNFVAAYLTFVQFNLRLKFCTIVQFYTIVHLLLEEFRFLLKSSWSI